MAISTEKRKILIDADAFIGLIYAKDANHQFASKIVELLTDVQLITSSHAYGEAITILSQKAGRNVAFKFIYDIGRSSTQILDVGFALRLAAEKIFKRQTSKNVSFTDCVNMAILEKFGLREIFSFDSDYKKNGFVRVGVDKKLEGEVVNEEKK